MCKKSKTEKKRERHYHGEKHKRPRTASTPIKVNQNSNGTRILYCFLLNTIKLQSLLTCSFWNRCKQLKNFNQNVL